MNTYMHVSPHSKTLRRQMLSHWLHTQGIDPSDIQEIAADASARRYYRVNTVSGTRIAADAPPESEDNNTFLSIAAELSAAKIRVPAQFSSDSATGFLLMEDFGDTTFERALNTPDQETLYSKAMDLLVSLHRLPCAHRPPYDRELIHRELALFTQHYLPAAGAPLQQTELPAWRAFCDWIASAFEDAPAVWTHRDYHCRNLMALDGGDLGVIDFQGALAAPAGYDLASILRDCYVDLPDTQYDLALSRYINHSATQSRAELQRSIDLLGLQRHLKCLGLFVRLAHKQKKQQYLSALPRTAGYVKRVSAAYPEAQIVSSLLARCPVERVS